jgi:hypothetical protein
MEKVTRILTGSRGSASVSDVKIQFNFFLLASIGGAKLSTINVRAKAEEVSSRPQRVKRQEASNHRRNEQSDFRAGIRPWTDRIWFFFTMTQPPMRNVNSRTPLEFLSH